MINPDKVTIMRKDNVLFAVNKDHTEILPLVYVGTIPPDFANLLEASVLMLQHIKATREAVTSILETLEQHHIDHLTPAFVAIISAAQLTEEAADKGVAAIAQRFLKKE